MPRKPVDDTAKSPPVQVRFAPAVLARLRDAAGPNGTSDFIRESVDARLGLLDQKPEQPTFPQPASPAPAQSAAFEFDRLLTAISAVADATTASSLVQHRRAEDMTKQLASVNSTAESMARQVAAVGETAAQLNSLVRQVAAMLTLFAKPLGVSESDIGALLVSMQAKPNTKKK